jgi:transcriptional regulator with XRE-family HTH domain
VGTEINTQHKATAKGIIFLIAISLQLFITSNLKLNTCTIVHMRRARNWRQIDLAEHSGIHEVHISDLERGTREPGLRTLSKIVSALAGSPHLVFEMWEYTNLNLPSFFCNSAYNFESFMHTIEEKGSAMERNPQQQKQGAARCLSIFTFPIPDPYLPSTVHQPLFTDHWSLIPVKAHCSL